MKTLRYSKTFKAEVMHTLLDMAAVYRVAPLRAEGYTEAILALGEHIYTNDTLTAVWIADEHFDDIRAKYNPNAEAIKAAEAVLSESEQEDSSNKDETQAALDMFNLEGVPDAALDEAQLAGRTEFTRRLAGRNAADCATCDLNTFKLAATIVYRRKLKERVEL